MTITEKKAEALKIYKEAKEQIKTVADMKNPKKWIAFCEAKNNCMRLGVRI